jgi:hypothetical protein
MLQRICAVCIYIESRTPAHVNTPASLFEVIENGGYWNPSSAKSSAPAPELTDGHLQATDSLYSSNVSTDQAFIFHIGNQTGFTPGSHYNIYLTVPGVSTANAPQSDYIIGDTAHPEGSPLQQGAVALDNANAGNKWLEVAHDIVLGDGAFIKVQEHTGQPDRLYADAVRVMLYAGVTPTPSPTPTPRPTQRALSYPPEFVVDDVPETEFDPENGFICDPLVADPDHGRYPWWAGTGASSYGSDYWDRVNRVTASSDFNASATWSFTSVPKRAYSVGFWIPQSSGGFDNCYYTIMCPAESVNEQAIVSQNSCGGTWRLLKENLTLSNKVVVRLDNRGRYEEYIGSTEYADAIGLFLYPPPLAAQSRWDIYE